MRPFICGSHSWMWKIVLVCFISLHQANSLVIKKGVARKKFHSDGTRTSQHVSEFERSDVGPTRHAEHRITHNWTQGRNQSGHYYKIYTKKPAGVKTAQPTSKENLTVVTQATHNVSVKGNQLREHLEEEINCSSLDFGRRKDQVNSSSHCHSPNESLICFQDPIFCEAYYSSGKRDLTWPVYGEYSFLPHEHWFKVLQHGGVAFLYHPCIRKSLIAELRALAEQCLRRFIMTPYRKLNPNQPIALVTWGCYLLMSDVDFHKSKHWMRQHAFKGPSTHVHKNGKFGKKLVKASRVVTDIKDTFLCPDEMEKAAFQPTPDPSKLTPLRGDVSERILRHRLAKVQHKKTLLHVNVTLTKVNKSNAAWAVGSLVFLCGLLVALMIYTKLWEKDARGSRYQYAALFDQDQELPRPKKRRFNFMKSSQSLIGKMKRKKKRRGEKLSEMKLLTPIDEENEDSSDDF